MSITLTWDVDNANNRLTVFADGEPVMHIGYHELFIQMGPKTVESVAGYLDDAALTEILKSLNTVSPGATGTLQ